MGAILASSVCVLTATLGYVAVLHLFHPPEGNRDDHIVVRSRIHRALISTLANVILAAFIMTYAIESSESIGQAFNYFGLGINWLTIVDVARTIILFAGLFIGPIMKKIVEDYQEMNRLKELYRYSRDETREIRNLNHLNDDTSGKTNVNTVQGKATETELQMRDYLVAPGTEEITYTGIAAGIFQPFFENHSGMKENVIIWTPFLFGTAHLHHAFELCKEGYPKSAIIFTVTFQLLYTTLFGVLTNLVFFNSESIWCCIAAHSFCNFMGVPSLNPRTENMAYKFMYWLLLAFGVWFFRTRFNSLTMPISSQ